MSYRRQLTLFVDEKYSGEMENVRKKYNPVQFGLIKAHVTLCREDELENISPVMTRLKLLKSRLVTLHFGKAERFAGGKGVLLPVLNDQAEYHNLRKEVLENSGIRFPEPHITLMHPGNSTCTNEIFSEIQKLEFPPSIIFSKISVIEQTNGERWKITDEFEL